MKLKALYQEIVKKGIEADLRGKKEIERLLVQKKKEYEKLSPKKKEFFDKETLTNPFSDTRILYGDPNAQIKSVMVGVDVEGPELLTLDRLRQKGKKIDLAISHHPEGKAYANFYEVMDLQVDAFAQKGISVSASEKLLSERKAQVQRRVHAANHQRGVDIARLLDINLLCAHTVADNLAYQFVSGLITKKKPKTLGEIVDLLGDIPEYRHAAMLNNPPLIVAGSKQSRVSKIMVEFTGGTEGPGKIYEKLAAKGVDTVVSMHQSEDHVKKCKAANLNIVFASHIASDNIGMNLLLDHLMKKEKLTVYECSGFKRVLRKKK